MPSLNEAKVAPLFSTGFKTAFMVCLRRCATLPSPAFSLSFFLLLLYLLVPQNSIFLVARKTPYARTSFAPGPVVAVRTARKLKFANLSAVKKRAPACGLVPIQADQKMKTSASGNAKMTRPANWNGPLLLKC